MDEFSDAMLRRDYNGLSEEERLFAQTKMLANFLREIAATLAEYDDTPDARLIYGTKNAVVAAQQLAEKNLAATLQLIPEDGLQHLCDRGVISEQECAEAITTKRTLELSRGSGENTRELDR